MKKDKKDQQFTNRVKLILAGIGFVFFALIIFFALYESNPIQATAEPNHDNVFNRNESGVVVSISPGHPANETEFNQMIGAGGI